MKTAGALLLLLAACGGSAPAGSTPTAATSDGGVTCAAGDVPCAFVSAHDGARAAATPTPAPPLPAMTWSDAAATAAAAWARQCTWSHDPALQSEGYGQNLYASTDAPAPGVVVTSWVSEAASYDYASNQCAAGAVCGHYTQVVWRGSTGLGCAIQPCASGSPIDARFGTAWWIAVCDYAPPGNWVGQRPY